MAVKESDIMKKAYIVYILEILKKETDEDHVISQVDLQKRILKNHDLLIERKAVKANIEALIAMGYPIKYKQGAERNGKCLAAGVYYDLSEEEMTDSMLKVLIDSVLCSSYVNAKQADRIVNWLKKKGSISLRNSLSVTTFKSDKYVRHTDSGILFLIIEDLNEAIIKKRKIRFDINDLDENGKLKVKENAVTVSPYHTATSNGQYYLICNRDGTDELSNIRIDKISNTEVLYDVHAVDIHKIDPTFDLEQYMAQSTYMFSGKEKTRRIVLRIKRDCFSALFDYFGDKFKINQKESDEEYAVVTLKANLDGMYYWALQYADNVEVLEPQELRDKIRNRVASMSVTYSITDDDKYSMAMNKVNGVGPNTLDGNFRQFLRGSLNLEGINLKGKNTYKKMENVHSLRVGNNHISDYSFINNYKDLRILHINEPAILNNLILDLPNLNSLFIAGWHGRREKEGTDVLKNFDAVKSCRNLKRIYYHPSIEVDNFDALYELPELEFVVVNKAAGVDKLDPERFLQKAEVKEDDREITITFPDNEERHLKEAEVYRKKVMRELVEEAIKRKKEKNEESSKEE